MAEEKYSLWPEKVLAKDWEYEDDKYRKKLLKRFNP